VNLVRIHKRDQGLKQGPKFKIHSK